MPDWKNYRYGVQQVSDSVFSYLLPDGSWSLNNTAVVVNGGQALLIDTLVDIPMTKRMLAEMASAAPNAGSIDTVVLTHWHIDHVHGVCVDELKGSRIIASRICADYMKALPPDKWKESIEGLTGDAKLMMDQLIGDKFNFDGLFYRAPTDLFEGSIDLRVGALNVAVREMKPNHTLSDSIVFIRNEGVVHTGDLLFTGRHIHLQYPMMQNLIDDYDAFLSLDADIFIPGHGPIAKKADVRDMLEYCRFLQAETRQRYDRGLPADLATEDLLANLGAYRQLKHPASLYTTIDMMYAEFSGDATAYARKDYQGYLAKQWRLKTTVPEKFPDLFTAH